MMEAYYEALTGLVLVGSLHKPVWTQTQRHPRASAFQVLRLKEYTTIFIQNAFTMVHMLEIFLIGKTLNCVQSPGFALQCRNKYVSK